MVVVYGGVDVSLLAEEVERVVHALTGQLGLGLGPLLELLLADAFVPCTERDQLVHFVEFGVAERAEGVCNNNNKKNIFTVFFLVKNKHINFFRQNTTYFFIKKKKILTC